jgi:hypothetical protein
MTHESESEDEQAARARALVEANDAKRPYFGGAIAAMVRAAHGMAPAAPSLSSTTQDSRRELRVVIEARNKTQEAFKKAAATLARAEELRHASQAKLKQFAGIDAAVSQFRTNLVRAHVNGGPAPALALNLPAELEGRVRAKEQAQQLVEAHGAVVAELGAELNEARRRLVAAQSAVEVAAQAVLMARAADLSDELGKARAHVCELYDMLHGASSVWIPGLGKGGGVGLMELPPAALQELQRCEALAAGAVRQRGQVPGSSYSAGNWQETYRILCQDPDAALPGAAR